ncbi:MAG: response regulator [Desulfobacterales bacterium]|nr:response regulator [Desulfobacterales bacterium]MCP4161765.1 response regulator [Deltaproteobacteria bacterium]
MIDSILIVDDDVMFRKVIKAFLERKNIICKVAESAEEGLDILAEFLPDLVISDIAMPGKDGIKFMKLVKDKHPELNFIIMTGLAEKYTYCDIINSGASDYMSKPFEMAELAARIDRIERETNIHSDLIKTNNKLEKSVKRANKLAEISDKHSQAKSQFLARMSHEIRTPLNGIIGFTEILLDTELTKEQKEYASITKMSGESLLTLVNDILDFSKIEAGQMELEMIDFDPEILFFDVCDLIRPKIDEKNIEITCRVGEKVPSIINGDPHRFRQLLLNIMGNSAKFTKEGEININVSLQEEDEDTVILYTKIMDTGIGISEEKIDIIFDEFIQADNTTTREYGGTGLGLSICKQIVNLMEGDIWVKNNENIGCTFHFTTAMRKSSENQRKKSKKVNLTDKVALVADNNSNSLEITSYELRQVGMIVIEVQNGDDVLKLLGENDIDICIIDTNIPQLDETILIDKIREDYKNTALLALTAPVPGDAGRCEQIGYEGFLAKPVRRDKLLQMTSQLIGIRSQNKPKERKILTKYSLIEDMKRSVSILLVEDNPVNQKLAKLMLERAGYAIDVAINGLEAIERVNKKKYNVILMDIQMPGMDGYQTTRQIRQYEDVHSSNRVPIIAVTANALKGDKTKCIDSGMDDYISKPIKREEIFEMIEKWVL